MFSATLTTTTAPTIKPGGIVNSTTLSLGGTIAPGSIASVLGSFPVATPAQAPTTGATWPTALSAVSVDIDGISAPLYYVSNSLIHFEVPWEVAGRKQAPVTVAVNGLRSAPAIATIGDFAPGIYSMNGQGSEPGAVLDSAFRLVDTTNPSTPGAYLQIYATGLGAVTNRPPSGQPAPLSTLSWTTTMPVVTVGGIAAPVLFSGLVPTAIGYYQINFQVPAGIPLGDAVPVTISMAGIPANPVTIVLKAYAPPNPAPNITSLSPSSASAGSGPLVVGVVGTGFTPSTTVTFNGTARTSTFVSATQLTLTLSTTDLKQAGAFTVTVQNAAPGGGTSDFTFNVVQTLNPAPTISSLSPSSATAGLTSLTLTVNGAGFTTTSTVTFGGLAHASVFVSASQLQTTLTASDLAVADTYSVVVTNPAPGGGQATGTFTVNSAINPIPTITGLTESVANDGTGRITLTITGTGFLASTTVILNGTDHTATLISSGQLTFTLTPSDLASSGPFTLVLTNPAPGGGQGTVKFTLNLILSPSSASAGSGPLTVTITGPGFSASTIATFNGIPHPATLVNNAQLTIILSAADLAVAGSFPIAVTSPGGATPPATFNVTQGLSIAGQWQGTWASTIGHQGAFSAILNQSGSTLTGTMLVTNSRCFTSLGTVLTGSVVSGSNIVLNVAFGNVRMVVNDGQTNGRGAIIGHYSVQGSPLPSGCAAEGLAGGITLSQN